MNTRQIGGKSEDAVEKYLLDAGFASVKRNYVTPYGEADIIMKDKNEFVFVEVKSRSTAKFGTPAEAVTKKKKLRYLQIAQYFFMSEKIENYAVRFDVAEVYNTNAGLHIDYIQNAFDFTDLSDFY